MIEWFRNPWVIAFVSAYCVWFSIPAWCAVYMRTHFTKMTARQWALIGLFLILVLLEAVQLGYGSLVAFNRRDHWSLSRYFGVLAPLLYGWCAWLFVRLCRSSRRGWAWAGRIVVGGYFIWILAGISIPFFKEQYTSGPARDNWLAGQAASTFITEDWDGPARRSAMRFSTQEYFTDWLPVVFDSWGAGAWHVRGQSEGACLGAYDRKPDYLLMSGRNGYRGIEKLNPDEYDAVGEIESIADTWTLLKRRMAHE